MARQGSGPSRTKVAMPSDNHFATPDEIAQRTKNTYANPPTNFRQPDGGGSGKSLADMNWTDAGGALKNGSL